MSGYEIKFNIYAESQEEADEMSAIIGRFIDDNAQRGIAVTAGKVVEAVRRWGNNPFVRNKITNYFKN